PSTAFCATVELHGNVFTTTNPTAASPAWGGPYGLGNYEMGGVSCPSTSWCAAVADLGETIVSPDPTAATPIWKPVPADTVAGLTAVSCVSATQCVAVDNGGEVLTGAWSGPFPPEPVSSPTLSGTPMVGQTLTEAHGAWTNAPASYAYTWERCG